MFYLQTIRKLLENIKSNAEIPNDEKARATELLKELSHLLALY